ncbi:MAG: hypothetical protein U0031_11250 [Thermomicrobiales bacterium]
MIHLDATRRPRFTTFTVIVVLIGVAALTSALLQAPATDPVAAKRDFRAHHCGATPLARPFDPQLDYDQARASDEIRAYHGAIFVARVDALEGETVQPSGGTAPPHQVQHYLATVDRSLVGQASGQVPIVYLGADDDSFEAAGFGPLRIGERYLFFAGGDRAGTEFYVEAGTGAILITCDQQEEKLVEKYLPLIAEAEQYEQEVIARATRRAEVRDRRMGITPTVTTVPD